VRYRTKMVLVSSIRGILENTGMLVHDFALSLDFPFYFFIVKGVYW